VLVSQTPRPVDEQPSAASGQRRTSSESADERQ
jgi:hypothetical protein